MQARWWTLLIGALAVLWTGQAAADTLTVGSGKTYATIADAMAAAGPGDVVEVMGNQTYRGTIKFTANNSGTVGSPVTVRGTAVAGKLPVLEGVGTGEWDTMVVLLNANHFVLEGFEIVGDANPDNYCVVHKADDVIVRGVVVHDCSGMGLLGTDSESGSLTLECSRLEGSNPRQISRRKSVCTQGRLDTTGSALASGRRWQLDSPESWNGARQLSTISH